VICTPAVVTDVTSVHTNKFPTDAIRGAGRPEATHLIEVVMDQLAHELGMDALELRRKNFIPPFATGHETPIGVVYDSGNYEAALDKLLEHIDPVAVRAEAEMLREKGIYRGIGFSTYTEICGNAPSRAVGPGGFGLQGGGWESATVRVHATGSVTLYTGTSPHGQGHETGFAQIVADRLGLDPSQVEVIHGDTDTGPFGLDTYGSRSLAVGGEAAARAAGKVAAKAKTIVAHQLEAAPEDIELKDGKFSVRGSPDKGLTLAEVAGAAKRAGEAMWPMPLPEELRKGLDSAVADIANVAQDRAGGMLVAGHFLREFAPAGVPWVHLDIAGPAYNDGGAYGYISKGGTGAAVRTLVQIATDAAEGRLSVLGSGQAAGE